MGEATVTLTLTKMPDGTVTCDSGDGNPQPYPTVEDALEAAKTILDGGGDEDEDDEARPGEAETGAIPGAGEGGQ